MKQPISRVRGHINTAAVFALAILVVVGIAYYMSLSKKGTAPALPQAPQPVRDTTSVVPATSRTASTTAGTWKPFVADPKIPIVPNTVTDVKVTGCAPSPKNAEIQMNASIKFINADAVPHYIVFSPEWTFTVPAKDSKTVRFNFWDKPGVRFYGCDTKTRVGSVTVNTN